MKGGKPTPNVIKLRRGSQRANRAEPRFEVAPLEPPPYVTGVARDKWQEVAPQLERAGVLRRINETTLARYCLDWERYTQALKHIEENGEFYVTDAGLMKRNPAGAAASELSRLLLALESEFGMTPSSSARLQAPKSSEDDDDAEFFGSGA